MAGGDLADGGLFDAAALFGHGAAGMEAAARRRIERARHLACRGLAPFAHEVGIGTDRISAWV